MFKSEKNGQANIPSAPLADSSNRSLAHADIIVHSMPDRFRLTESKADKAKQTGVMILSLGVIFLLAIAGLFWYFMFGPGKSQPSADMNALLQENSPTETKVAEKEPVQPLETKTAVNNRIETGDLETATKTADELTSQESGNVASGTASTTQEAAQQGTSTSKIVYKISVDSDSDGLTDEEEAVIGSRSDFPQSDSDSYSDLSEFQNLYNPAGEGKLTDNPAIGTYRNNAFGYSFIYPKIWQYKKVGGDESIVIDSGKGQFLQVITMPNAENKDIELWYQEQFSDDRLTYDRIKRTSTWSGISSSDGMTVYLTDANKKYIVTLSYTVGAGDTLFYPNIFMLMINSFAFNE